MKIKAKFFLKNVLVEISHRNKVNLDGNTGWHKIEKIFRVFERVTRNSPTIMNVGEIMNFFTCHSRAS